MIVYDISQIKVDYLIFLIFKVYRDIITLLWPYFPPRDNSIKLNFMIKNITIDNFVIASKFSITVIKYKRSFSDMFSYKLAQQ